MILGASLVSVSACFEDAGPVGEGGDEASADTASPATTGDAEAGATDTGAGDSTGAADAAVDSSEGNEGPTPVFYGMCDTDTDCSTDETCIPGTNTCAPGCESDVSCPPPPSGSATPECVPVVGTCRLVCNGDDACPTGMSCAGVLGDGNCVWTTPV